MACDAAEFRSAVEAMGATPVVPSRKNAKQKQPCPGFIDRHRNLIERCWSRLKEWRAIATRYDKTATSYAARISIAATLDWFKSSLRQAFKCEQALTVDWLLHTSGVRPSVPDVREALGA